MLLPDELTLYDEPHEPTLTTLGVEPALFRVRGLLTPHEAAALYAAAEPKLEPSQVRSSATPGAELRADAGRTTASAWLHGHQDPSREVPEARQLQRRVGALLRLPEALLSSHLEPVLVEAAAEGEFYAPHVDYLGAPTSGDDARAHDAARQPTLTLTLALTLTLTLTLPHTPTPTPNPDPDPNPNPNQARQPTSGGANRAAVVLVFLTDADDAAGGHAVFPFVRGGKARGAGGAGSVGGVGGEEAAEAADKALAGAVAEAEVEGTHAAGDEGAPPCDFPTVREP